MEKFEWLDHLRALADAIENGDELPELPLPSIDRLWEVVRESEPNYG